MERAFWRNTLLLLNSFIDLLSAAHISYFCGICAAFFFIADKICHANGRSAELSSPAVLLCAVNYDLI